MDYVLLVLSILLMVTGFFGCILPAIPGPPLNFIGLILLHFTKFAEYPTNLLIILGVITAIVQILDYFVPIWGAKKFGGTKAGMWGSIIGLIAGLFFLPAIGPFGIITILGGPFLGAYIGEKLAGNDSQKALKAAFGTFIGFVTGTLLKLALSVTISVFFFKELWKDIFN